MIPVYNIYIVKTILCKHKLHILEILACGTRRRLKNGSASLCHYQRNEFYIFEFVAACGPRQTHFHTEAQTDSRDWRNPLRKNLTVLPASPFCRCATSVPLFVTCGDISPRRGENLSRPGEVFPLRGSFICADRKMAKSSPFGGAGIEQSEMTERVSHPRAGMALLIRVKLQKLISLKRSHFKLFFCPKWSIMRQ